MFFLKWVREQYSQNNRKTNLTCRQLSHESVVASCSRKKYKNSFLYIHRLELTEITLVLISTKKRSEFELRVFSHACPMNLICSLSAFSLRPHEETCLRARLRKFAGIESWQSVGATEKGTARETSLRSSAMILQDIASDARWMKRGKTF